MAHFGRDLEWIEVDNWHITQSVTIRMRKTFAVGQEQVDLRRFAWLAFNGSEYATGKGLWIPVKFCKEIGEKLIEVYNQSQNR